LLALYCIIYLYSPKWKYLSYKSNGKLICYLDYRNVEKKKESFSESNLENAVSAVLNYLMKILIKK
jgi:hypothetical protein